MLPKVLLVEDDDAIREIYAMKFELEGFSVATARNGQLGLKMVADFQPEVILLDMMMPVMGGLDFMRTLNASQANIHVIVFSNVSAPNQVDAVMRLGAKAYWIKSDYTPERCVAELVQLWRGQATEGATT